jgi:hypothetical protein
MIDELLAQFLAAPLAPASPFGHDVTGTFPRAACSDVTAALILTLGSPG